jgi:hypothetical protein
MNGKRDAMLHERPLKKCGSHGCRTYFALTSTAREWFEGSIQTLSQRCRHRKFLDNVHRRPCWRSRGAGSCPPHNGIERTMETPHACRYFVSTCQRQVQTLPDSFIVVNSVFIRLW